MKKFLVAALALVMSGSAFAIDNEPEEGVSAQVFLGLTASNIRSLEMSTKAGGTFGFKLDYMLPNAHGTYINGGVDWIMKGAKESIQITPAPGIDIDGTEKINGHYLEIPIHVGFRYNIMPELGVFGEVGPYFSFGVGGKHKLTADVDGYREYSTSTKTFKKSQDGFQRWDAGMGFRVGAEYNQHYSLSLGCDWGFTDMFTDDFREKYLPGFTPKNFAFVMAFGYRF